MSGGDSAGMSRPSPHQGEGGVVKSTTSQKLAAFLADMEKFRKRVPRFPPKRNFFSSEIDLPTPTKDLAIQPPTRPKTITPNITKSLQAKASISTDASLSRSFESTSKTNWLKRISPVTSSTTPNTTPNRLGNKPRDEKQKTQSTSRWSSSGFFDDDEASPYSSSNVAAPKPIPALSSKDKMNGTTTYEITNLLSESEDDEDERDDDDDDDEDEIDSEDDDDDEDDAEEEGNDDEDDDDDDDDDRGSNDGRGNQIPQRSNSSEPKQDIRPPSRAPMKTPLSAAAELFPQLRDHNEKAVKLPRSFEGWKSNIGGERPKSTDSESESSLLSPQLTLVRQRTRAGENPQPPRPNARRSTLNDDILLYESLKANARNLAPKPSTVFVSQLPEPSQICAATTKSRNLEKRSAKRKAWEPQIPASAKRQRQGDIRRNSTVFEWESSRQESDENGTIKNYAEHHRGQDLRRGSCPFPLPASPQRLLSPPPIDESRVVMQFTVFRTRRLVHPFDGDLTGKIIRSGSFVDKGMANRRAEALLPSPGPSVARMELDYGEDVSGRNGMFFGRVEYRDGKIIYVYVDCEYQQFGRIDPSEFDGKRMHPKYKQLCLTPRYDVFVFLRKPMSSQDGVVYEYEEESRPEPVVDVIDDEDSDVESNHQNGTEGPVVEANSAEHCDQGNSSDMNETIKQSMGMHFEPKFEGSFTTLALANAKAVDAFARWTRPQPPARMDAVMYYRDILQPFIDEFRRQFCEDQDAREATRGAEIVWEASPQFRYDYEAINVVVVKSEMQGPLDLTGAFCDGG